MAANEMRRIAERQGGHVHEVDLRGLRAAEVRHELSTSRWERVEPGLYRLVGAPRHGEDALHAAVLRAGVGALVSHEPAVHVWGVPGYLADPPHVTVVRRHRRHDRITGVVIHERRRLPDEHRTEVRGLPVVTPEQALIDVAAGSHPDRTERLFDVMLARRLTTPQRCVDALARLGRRGRPEAPVIARLALARLGGYRPPTTSLEARMAQVLREGGLDGFVAQVHLGGDAPVGRVDFAHERSAVVIEVQSELFHSSATAREDDRRRHDDLRAAGFTVVAVDEVDVWHRPARVQEAVRRAVRTRRQRAVRPN